MYGAIIVKDGKNLVRVLNIAGYIDMSIRKCIDKADYQIIDEDHKVIIFTVKTKKKIFNTIKATLNKVYPGLCLFLEKQGRI